MVAVPFVREPTTLQCTPSDDTHPRRGHAGTATTDRDPRVRPARSSSWGSVAAHDAVRGLRNRRALVARTALRRSLSDHSRARLGRRTRIDSWSASMRSTAHCSTRAIAPCFSTCTGRAVGAARAPFTGRRHVADRGASTASRIRPTEGLFGGWAQHIYLEPGVGIARLPDAGRRRRLHWRWLRDADRRAYPRARGSASRAIPCSSRASAPSACARSHYAGLAARRRSLLSAIHRLASISPGEWVPMTSSRCRQQHPPNGWPRFGPRRMRKELTS